MTESQSENGRSAGRDGRSAGRDGRSAADVSTLLIELGRVLKACRFYPGEHPARKEAVDRGYRAWRADLERGGPLELEIRQSAFRVAGSREPVGRGALDDLAREFVYRGVSRTAFTPELSLEAFCALAELLALDPDQVAEEGGVEQALLARETRGLSLNAADYAGHLERAQPAPAAGAAPAAAGAAPASAQTTHEEVDASPEDTDLPAPLVTGSDPLSALGGLLGPRSEMEDGELTPETETDPTGEFIALLRQLDECRSDEAYEGLIREVIDGARSLSDQQMADDAYRAVLVLSSHGCEAVRSDRQRTLAEEALFQLAVGARLDDIVSRACRTGPQASVRATQILLQLGAHAVPRLFEMLGSERDPDRRGQMTAILIAMGAKATPAVIEALRSEDEERQRLVARLAGEIQNPDAVPALRGLLKNPSTPADLQKEVAKALLRIGSPRATEALVDAVDHPDPDIASVAAFCLGGTGHPRALEALLGALRRAQRQDQLELAREVIRALGRLGREEAVPELATILAKRGLFRRRRLRELKLSAAAALSRLPGDEALRILEDAARSGDAQVRRSAQTALTRRRNEARAPA